MKNYQEFLQEKYVAHANAFNAIEMPKYAINFADESLEGLRIRLLDKYYANEKDKEKKEQINRCISTYVYTLDKRLKIDEKIVELLGQLVGKSTKEMGTELSKETDDFYNQTQNLYGQNSG